MAIKEQLNNRGMTQKEFAARMDMSEKHISKLINGEVQLTPETAVRLETVLDVPASFWNNLESIYREKLVKIAEENALDEDIQIARIFPYIDIAKLGWVPKTTIAKEKALNLRKYFEVYRLSLLENNMLSFIACRRISITKKSDLALLAWAQQAKRVGRNMDTKRINIEGLYNLIPLFRSMTIKDPSIFQSELSKVLADCGIALVLLPHIRGSFLHGATFIDGSKIVLGLTVRGRDADRFWFSFFHELGHVVLGHIGKPEGLSEEDEVEADKWARDNLIDAEAFNAFVNRGVFSVSSICEFSAAQGVAPGIVVGRMQSENIIKYNMFNSLKEKYELNPKS